MARTLNRVRYQVLYNQVRNQETSTKIKAPIEPVPPSTAATSGPYEPHLENLKIPEPISTIKLRDLEPITLDSTLKIVQSFDEVPGPRSLKYFAAVLRFVPVIGKYVSAGMIQYMLSTGSQILSGGDVHVMKAVFEHYGPICRIEVPFGGNIVMISRVEHMQTVFENEGRYPIRSALDCIEKYRLQHRKYKQAGPFITHGPEWIRLRNKIENPVQNMLQVQAPNIEKSCERMVERIRSIRNQQEEMPKEFVNEIFKWSMDCLSYVSFNKDMGFWDSHGLRNTSESAVILNSLLDATNAIRKCEGGLKLWNFLETYDWKALVKHLDTLDCVFSKYIGAIELALKDKEDNQNAQIGTSLVEALLLKDDMSSDDLLTVIVDLMIIGINTTTHATAYLLYHLARAPKVQKRLFNEIKNVKLDSNPETYENLPYLQACIKESLRLKPPVPVLTRVLTNDIVIHNYRIPKDTFVLMATNWESIRTENFDDPTQYKPERWLDDDISTTHTLATVPFGYGPKACLARKLANLQLSMLISKVVKSFMIQYNYGDICTNPRWSTPMLAVPRRPLRFRFIERE